MSFAITPFAGSDTTSVWPVSTELYVSVTAVGVAAATGAPAPLTLMYASIPPSRAVALLERLSSRSKIGSAGVVQVAGGTGVQAAGTLIITSVVLPAAMNTSLCTRGTPGSTLPSSAMSEKPETAAVPLVWAPTIEGTCIRRPAFTSRTSTVPPAATPVLGVGAYTERAGAVLSNPRPLTR